MVALRLCVGILTILGAPPLHFARQVILTRTQLQRKLGRTSQTLANLCTLHQQYLDSSTTLCVSLYNYSMLLVSRTTCLSFDWNACFSTCTECHECIGSHQLVWYTDRHTYGIFRPAMLYTRSLLSSDRRLPAITNQRCLCCKVV